MTPASARERAEIAREHLRVAEERLAACTDGPSREASVSAANAISAAADAICGIALGHPSSGADHREAAALLAQVADGARLARRLVRLTAQKSQAQYGDYVTARVARDVTASAGRLVSALPRYGV
ncbi:hypothetical protein [Cellulosimicrobium cellulans]|uniref:hypothetical protein n=1 Tax=Cellulosimicrobium cellulans TaxID=1710 RepID=UPI001651D342|nr:hypothetical protein [Cellulosimicrobium cellulans]